MKYKNKIFLFISIILVNNVKADDFILLTDRVLTSIDGIPHVMDEFKIYNSIFLGQQISILQYGKVNDKTKKRDAQHEYKGKKYTLKQLIQVEHELEEKNKTIKNSNPPAYEKEFKSLKDTLNKIKEEFEGLSQKYLKEAQGAEEEMKKLIAEFCQKAKRHDSLLLNWSRSKNAMESFRNDITSFKLLDLFFTDLTNFLKSLVNSCPKALARYKEWIKHNKHSND